MENRMKNSEIPLGMGGSLIVTVLVVLCLIIFAALSFTTAYSDYKLSLRAQEITEDYYRIHGLAEEKLSEISDVLYGIKGMDTDIAEKLKRVEGLFIEGELDELSAWYEVLGSKNQKITVSLNILFEESKDSYYYEITSWNLSNIELPVYEEEYIELWEGFN
ncbi:MAG TPA: hypothetical protein GX396_05445 [Tissierellia bacterium]|jgi:hypothetical protein|nr:hypothetical protein [Tissierellia bacterium]